MKQETTHSTDDGATVTIRRVDTGARDRANLATLAERDSRKMPQGMVLGAEVRGQLIAAIAIDSGEILADPFRHTDELRSLLELRAAQLRRRGSKHRRRLPAPRRHGRPAVGGSPAGQIITLPHWS